MGKYDCPECPNKGANNIKLVRARGTSHMSTCTMKCKNCGHRWTN